MKKTILIIGAGLVAGAAYGQSAIDAYRLSQPDLKGTARFMSMGGAFGALGGDLSSISQNPAGIGVYRSNDIGLTLDLDAQRCVANAQGMETTTDKTRFLLNNIGGVLTMRLPSSSMPNINLGFTYNKTASFNRRYAGRIPALNTSLSNYIAGQANENGLLVGDVATSNGFDPYNPNDGGYAAPWLTILGYDGYLITPYGQEPDTQWAGQWEPGVTSGSGEFAVDERGGIDDYNIAIGGNICNMVYWGMNFDISNINYTLNSYWAESLDNAFTPTGPDDSEVQGPADWSLNNYYHVKGTGFKYQIGVIFKPVQEFRIGLAFHTPTWYSLTETYRAGIDYDYPGMRPGGATTNNGITAYNDVDFRTPMKFIGSLAGVIGGKFIISADYEWTPYDKMKYSEAGSYGLNNGSGDWPYSYGSDQMTRSNYAWAEDPYADTNSDIKYYYRATNTFRVGAEYRVTPSFSVRAGYCFVSSPVKDSTRDGNEIVYTSGTMPQYRFDNTTNYITCGLGYRYRHFYADLAYVYKNMKSTYHAFTPDIYTVDGKRIVDPSPQSALSLTNNQVVLSAGFRF